MENVSEIYSILVGTLRSNVSYDFLKKSKTQSGNTQLAERDIIRVVREILQMLELTFTEASSQQPYDFRIRLLVTKHFNLLKNKSVMVIFL